MLSELSRILEWKIALESSSVHVSLLKLRSYDFFGVGDDRRLCGNLSAFAWYKVLRPSLALWCEKLWKISSGFHLKLSFHFKSLFMLEHVQYAQTESHKSYQKCQWMHLTYQITSPPSMMRWIILLFSLWAETKTWLRSWKRHFQFTDKVQ